jgi:hypothetical protein
MSRALATTWLDDQILAAVRQRPEISTTEVCKAICSRCRTDSPYHHYSRVYQRLRGLARRGSVRSSGEGHGPYPSTTTWRIESAAGVDDEDLVGELEAAFRAAARGEGEA